MNKPTSRQSRWIKLKWKLGFCLAVALLWPLSYIWADVMNLNLAGRWLRIETGPGWFAFTNAAGIGRGKQPVFRNQLIRLSGSVRTELAYPRIYSSVIDYRFYCPLWIVSIIAGITALAAVLSHLRQNRLGLIGICEVCGYDLRATPDRCPECGTTP